MQRGSYERTTEPEDDLATPDREWWIPSDLVPDGHDDPWVRGDQAYDAELFPLPAGLP